MNPIILLLIMIGVVVLIAFLAGWIKLKEELMENFCEWTDNGESFYETSCGHGFFFDSGSSKENGFKFCPFCGKPISADDNETQAS